ncbi:STAS domain-containing protein [Streptomyces canus]|uniref:STAS domain-containing protein n=1 Tax=Streptomyces canus TaxID=58343 RepID=UPI003AF2798C
MRAYLDAATATGWPDVLVDLRQVEFFDFSGLRVLCRAASHRSSGSRSSRRRRDPRVRRTAPLRPPALGAGSRDSVRGAALPNCGPLGQITGTTRPRSLRTRRRSSRRSSSRTRWRRCVRRRPACPAIRRRP